MLRPVIILGLLYCAVPALAAEPVTIASSDGGLSELVTGLVRSHLPDQYEKRKNWGQTTDVWDGLHMSLDGVRLKTKRKKKQVNHGAWTMYRASLLDPNQFSVDVQNLRRLDDGRAAFDAEFYAPLAVFGRINQWQFGVQLISLSADAEARVRLKVTCAVQTRLEKSTGFVPDVVFEPEVVAAQVLLEEFRLKRISQLHGPLVKELGEEAHDLLQDEIDDRNAEIVAKLNKQIAKQQGKLRISLSELANTKFGDLREWVTPK